MNYRFLSTQKRLISTQEHKIHGRYGIVSEDGKILLPAEYDEIGEPENGYFLVKKEGKYGVMDLDFHICIPCLYDSIKRWGDIGYIITKRGQSRNAFGVLHFYYGILSEDNKEILPPEYDEIGEPENGYFLIKKNGKYGVMDLNFHICVPCILQVQGRVSIQV